MSKTYTTQNDILLENLLKYYRTNDRMERVLPIINGESSMSIRIIDWFVTNFAKKYYTVYNIYSEPEKTEDSDESPDGSHKSASTSVSRRFKVYADYKLKLKAYSKRRFDPFCRWQRISIPYKNGTYVQTTIGQLNFFKWALDNNILDYITKNYSEIEHDMNTRNSIAKKKISGIAGTSQSSTGSSASSTSGNTLITSKDDDDDRDGVDDSEIGTSNKLVARSGAGASSSVSAKSTHSLSSTTTTELDSTECGTTIATTTNGTRKRREELSVSAVRSMKREIVPIIVSFT